MLCYVLYDSVILAGFYLSKLLMLATYTEYSKFDTNCHKSMVAF